MKLSKRNVALFIALVFPALAFADVTDPIESWRDRLTSKKEGQLRVHSYCNDQKSAEGRAENFVISENAEGLVVVTEKKTLPPPMPVGLTETTKLRKTFVYLGATELQSLSASEQEAYLKLEKRMKIFDHFMKYISSLNCFEHSAQGARFSLTVSYDWVSEVILDSDLKKQSWKMDIYEAEMDFNSKIEKKFIFIGPCRVSETKPKCLDQLK